jgi:hypothetical protein
VLWPGQSQDGFGLGNEALPVTPVTEMNWQRSFRCGSHGSCVEIAKLVGGVAIRDGKAGDESPVLRFSDEEWGAFVAGIRAGDFD